MKIITNSFKKWKGILNEKGLTLEILNNEGNDIERLIALFNKIDSIYLAPQQGVSKEEYAKKLINHAYNFVVSDNNSDVGFLSLYANDYINKIAYVSTVGIFPSYRNKNIATTLALFTFDFSEEIGMKYVKGEVNKNNYKSLSLVSKYYQIESETEHNTFMIVRDL